MPHFTNASTFHVTTLGCKINQYESEAIAEAWRGQGLVEVESPAGAGVLLVNSCAVTNRAVKELRAVVRRLRLHNPLARLVVTGCAAQVLGAEFAAMPEVDEVVPQDQKAQLLAGPAHALAPLPAVEGPRLFPPFSVTTFHRARAMVKVQDGCSHGCTYCIVPLTRGPSVSRDPGEVLTEIRRLLDIGYRELVISGVNLRQYGRDLAAPLDFWDLLERIEAAFAPEWAGRARLRLSSIEPAQLGAKALDVLGGARLVAPQLHLSLQSGDAEVLRRMGRGHYKPEQVLDFLGQLRRFWPRFGLGADLLTGFPGESPAQFESTFAFCLALPLTYAHVFPFSPRPGTAAAGWSDSLPKVELTARAARLRGLAESKKRAFAKELSKLERLTVLIEGADADCGHGVSEFYASCEVRGQGLGRASFQPGSLVPMRPEKSSGGKVMGVLLEQGA